jgi:hypothetical protein
MADLTRSVPVLAIAEHAQAAQRGWAGLKQHLALPEDEDEAAVHAMLCRVAGELLGVAPTTLEVALGMTECPPPYGMPPSPWR